MSFRAPQIVAAAVLGCALTVVTATAQQLDPGISCIEGSVPGNDWAELNSRYKESIWDSKAAIRLLSFDESLDLTVTDQFGSVVCDATADSRTRCKFNFSSSYSGTFNIRVTNPLPSLSNYRICAE